MGLVSLKEAICARHAFNRIAREERGQGAPLYMCGAIQHSVAFVVCRRCKLFFIQLTPLLQPSRSHCRHRAHQQEDVRVCAALMAFFIFWLLSLGGGARHDRNRNCRHIRPGGMK